MTPALSQREPMLIDMTRLPHGAAIAAALRPAVPRLIDDMIGAIRAELPQYDRPLRGRFGQLVRRSTTASIERFLALIAGEERDARARSDLYVELGRGELRSGRPIETLLAAYRIGARVMWRGFAQEGQASGIEPETLYRLAEALFAFVDELSAESAEGYAEEQALIAGERERERSRMLEILARRPAADLVVIHDQAARAEWVVPSLAAPVAMPAACMSPGQLQSRLPAGSLAAAMDGMTIAIVPDLDAPGRAAEMERALASRGAARAATVPPEDLAEAMERAVLAARLQKAAVLPDTGLIDADAHLVTLILHRDADLSRTLADRALEPLDALSPSAAERLTETLAAWLEEGCDTPAAARALHVHVQTLRYRLRQLEEVLGEDRLASPDGRLELQLALRRRRAAA
jgi:hypothetical protein